ncbi:uncharacterized protein SCHCODRAFT_01093244 [Schizophyllum commune H4-8]|nr:uncharacterized protein SCHCODRAFT_01093244 [Schizophyllum commune H4-8]KAI5896027.1 hypothetical protein SCHCODRAFT_01093244 [Schizophyllum commune H4-8]
MDAIDNQKKAKSIIDAFLAKHHQTEVLPAGSFNVIDDLDKHDIRIKPEDNGNKTTYRLFTEGDVDDETEVTIYVVGALAQKLLPPLKPKRKYANGRHFVFSGFQQSVTLLGVGSASVDEAIRSIKVAYLELKRQVPDEVPFPSDRICSDNFVVSNPLFITGYDANDKESIPFSKLVDPYGHLTGCLGEGCVHTVENEVQYLEGYENAQGVFKQRVVSPTQFRPGDIVRVGFTISLTHNKRAHGRLELALVLRSLTLIDKTISAANMKALEETVAKGKKRMAVNRGRLVEDNEDQPVSKVRKAMTGLSLRDMDVDVVSSQASGSGSQ